MPWVNCEVTKTGPAADGTIFVALRADDGSFHRWFKAVSGMKKEMLATALTAISTSKKVQVFLTDTVAYSTVNNLYLRSS